MKNVIKYSILLGLVLAALPFLLADAPKPVYEYYKQSTYIVGDKDCWLDTNAKRNVPCDHLKEVCNGQINGSWYKVQTYTKERCNEINVTHYKNVTTGAVRYGDKDYYYEGYFCKGYDEKIVCHSCLDGTCQHGEDECLSGESCVIIDLSTNQVHHNISDRRPVVPKTPKGDEKLRPKSSLLAVS